MTTPSDTAGPDDPHARDELASAYLDGVTTAEENAQVERDVDLLRRVEQLAATRDRLAVAPQPTARADAQLAVALAAFDALSEGGVTTADAPGTSSPSTAPVTDLASRRRWPERVPLGAVAAAVMVLALVVGITRLDGGGDTTDMATGAALEADDAAPAAGDSAADDAGLDTSAGSGIAPESFGSGDSGDSATATGGVTTADDRPAYDDVDALAAALRDRLARTDPDGPPGDDPDTASRSSDPCDAVTVAGIDPEAVRIVESVLLAGQPVTAVVFLDADDMEQLALVDDIGCTLEAQRPL